jgi:hypothetical protein
MINAIVGFSFTLRKCMVQNAKFLGIVWTTEESGLNSSAKIISGPMLPHVHWLSLALSREVKRPGLETDNSLSFTVKVK